MRKSKKLNKILNKFIDSQDKLAKKYGVKIEIGIEGNMITIADGRKKGEKNE